MLSTIKKHMYYFIALCVSMVWASTFVCSKYLLDEGLTPSDIFLCRFVLAYIFIWPFSERRLLCGNLRDELRMVGLGVMGGSLYFMTENWALHFTYASNVSILVGTCPLVTALLLAFHYKDERMTLWQIIGSVLTFFGAALVILNGQFVLHLNLRGDLLALAASICWGFYSLFMKQVLGRYSANFITRKVFGYGVVTLLPVMLFPRSPFGGNVVSSSFSIARFMENPQWATVVFVVLFLGIVASLLCYLLWNVIMLHFGAVRVTNFVYVQPAFTMLLAAIVLGEKITPMAMVGVVLIVVGMLQLQRKKINLS